MDDSSTRKEEELKKPFPPFPGSDIVRKYTDVDGKYKYTEIESMLDFISLHDGE